MAIIGLNTKRQERLKRKNLISKKQLRDEWLKSKGYSVRYNSVEKQALKTKRAIRSLWKKPISSYMSMVRQFMKLKHEKKIEIYYMLHDKFGIPYYEMRKTLGQQIRGVK